MKKGILWIVVILWVMAGVQFLMGINKKDESQIIEAFHITNSLESISRVEACGKYNGQYLLVSEREKLLIEIAGKLGIEKNYVLESSRKKNEAETILSMKAKRADTLLKLTTHEKNVTDHAVETAQYLTITIEFCDSVESAVYFKEELSKIIAEYPVETQVALNLTGDYPEILALEEKNQIADEMLKVLEAKVVSEHRENDVFTIYAYSRLISEYKVVDKERINVTIAIYDNEAEDKTTLYLCTPIMNEDY